MSKIGDEFVQNTLSLIMEHAGPEIRKEFSRLILDKVTSVLKDSFESNYGLVGETVKSFVKQIVNDVLAENREKILESIKQELPLHLERLKIEATRAAYEEAVKGISRAIHEAQNRR